jgi:hypothetical protein
MFQSLFGGKKTDDEAEPTTPATAGASNQGQPLQGQAPTATPTGNATRPLGGNAARPLGGINTPSNKPAPTANEIKTTIQNILENRNNKGNATRPRPNTSTDPLTAPMGGVGTAANRGALNRTAGNILFGLPPGNPEKRINAPTTNTNRPDSLSMNIPPISSRIPAPPMSSANTTNTTNFRITTKSINANNTRRTNNANIKNTNANNARRANNANNKSKNANNTNNANNANNKSTKANNANNRRMKRASSMDNLNRDMRGMKLGMVTVYMGGITAGNARFRKAKLAAVMRKVASISVGKFHFPNGTARDETHVTNRQSAFLLLNILKLTNPFIFAELMKQIKSFPEKGMPSSVSYKQAAVVVKVLKKLPPQRKPNPRAKVPPPARPRSMPLSLSMRGNVGRSMY